MIKEEKEISLKEEKLDTFKEFLNFLYTGSFPISSEQNVLDFLIFSHKVSLTTYYNSIKLKIIMILKY
jgi:hypothetical protein